MYLRPTASTFIARAVRVEVRVHMASVLFSETLRSNASHILSITAILLARPSSTFTYCQDRRRTECSTGAVWMPQSFRLPSPPPYLFPPLPLPLGSSVLQPCPCVRPLFSPSRSAPSFPCLPLHNTHWLFVDNRVSQECCFHHYQYCRKACVEQKRYQHIFATEFSDWCVPEVEHDKRFYQLWVLIQTVS